MNKKVLIACSIFKEEIDFLLQKEGEELDIEIVWIDAGLHSDPVFLEKELSSALLKADDLGKNDVRLLFGWGCLPQMDSITAGKGNSMIAAKNCLSAFLGDDKARKLEQNNSMLMTPSWVRIWPANMKKFFGWNEVDFRMNLGRYDRILVLDSGLHPLTDDEILEFFDLVQVPVEFESLNLDHFHNILSKLLA